MCMGRLSGLERSLYPLVILNHRSRIALSGVMTFRCLMSCGCSLAVWFAVGVWRLSMRRLTASEHVGKGLPAPDNWILLCHYRDPLSCARSRVLAGQSGPAVRVTCRARGVAGVLDAPMRYMPARTLVCRANALLDA